MVWENANQTTDLERERRRIYRTKKRVLVEVMEEIDSWIHRTIDGDRILALSYVKMTLKRELLALRAQHK
jgi:hypothetical protein